MLINGDGSVREEVQRDGDAQELPVLSTHREQGTYDRGKPRSCIGIGVGDVDREILGSGVRLPSCVLRLLVPPFDHPKWWMMAETKQTRYSRERIRTGRGIDFGTTLNR